MRWLLDCAYIVVGLLLAPYWAYKLPTAPRYRAGLLQRLGLSPRMGSHGRRLWVHCASVGEASIPRELLAEALRRWPGWEVVFSTNTDTGARRLRELYPAATVFFMPLDLSPCVELAIGRVKPDAVILVELEVWPNFCEACRRRGVPIAIVNGRISPSSARLLRMGQMLLGTLWEPVRVCCARSAEDARRFVEAGLPAGRVFNCGSLKFDVAAVAEQAKVEALRQMFHIAPGAPVLVAGSTHPGEEAILAGVYRELKARHPALRMIVAPRRVERGEEAAKALSARGLSVARKTMIEAGRAAVSGSEVIVVDTIGDLMACYGLATCAFVGRSLLPPGGGQNVVEPAALGKPVVVGPYTSNFEPEMRLLRQQGAALVVHSPAELTSQIDRVLSDPALARNMAEAGRRVVLENRGATARTLSCLGGILAAAGSGRRPDGRLDGARPGC